MSELHVSIKSSYENRIIDIKEQKKIWLDISKQFKPYLTLYKTERPSAIIAKETGDLGISVLWIVQAALTRPVLKEIISKSEEDLSHVVGKIDDSSLYALAHSEDINAPVILSDNDENSTLKNFILNGEKKFITAGRNADLIILTCRTEGEEKINRIAIIDPKQIPESSITDLQLNIMRSVSHTRLTFKDYAVEKVRLALIDPSTIRRIIKKFGILERGLILEAFLSFLIYADKILTEMGSENSCNSMLSSLLEQQSIAVTKQITEGLHSDRIDTKNISFEEFMPVIEIFKKTYTKAEKNLPEAERIKLKDIFLFDNLKG
ncbi:MAG: acyl-CoA dehydrogenase family protein [Spirochaetes bacterium]|nr:acyl-CoA dehydrogenase family protein [Spirochaetota bacterium]